MKYSGSCHCGAVKFEVEAPDSLEVLKCNCSMCTKSGFLHLIADVEDFSILEGVEFITTYTFNTGVAKHTFCKVCGVKPFYTPRSHPNGVSVNVNCIDSPYKVSKITDFDGANWEENVHKISSVES